MGKTLVITILDPHSAGIEMAKVAMAKKGVPVVIVGPDEIKKQYDFPAALRREAIMQELLLLEITPKEEKIIFGKNQKRLWRKNCKERQKAECRRQKKQP